MDGEKLGVGSKGTMPIVERVCYPYVAGKRWLSGLVDTVGYQLVTFIISCHFFRSHAKLLLVVSASRSTPSALNITSPAHGDPLQPFCGALTNASTPQACISTQSVPDAMQSSTIMPPCSCTASANDRI